MRAPRLIALCAANLVVAIFIADLAVAQPNGGVIATSSTRQGPQAKAATQKPTQGFGKTVMSAEARPQLATSRLDTDRLLQLHIAEYQALSARSTNWTSLQYGLAGFTVAALALLIANLHLISTRFTIWAVALLYQSVMLAQILVLSMLFNNVRYIECSLRPTIQELIASAGDPALTSKVQERSFWRYEHYMKSHSPYQPVADYLLAPQSLIALLVAAWFRRKAWSRSDWFWLALSLGAFVLSLTLTSGMIDAHRAFLTCASR
jgi:hypothetical protein